MFSEGDTVTTRPPRLTSLFKITCRVPKIGHMIEYPEKASKCALNNSNSGAAVQGMKCEAVQIEREQKKFCKSRMTGTSVSRTNLSGIDVTCDVDNMYPDTTRAEGGTVRKLTGKARRVSPRHKGIGLPSRGRVSVESVLLVFPRRMLPAMREKGLERST